MKTPKGPRVKDQLAELELRPSKLRGQNFLHQESTAERIVDFSGISDSSVVVEIGPGLGMLSRKLIERAGRLIVIEVDEKLAGDLENNIPGIAAEDIVSDDVRKVQLGDLIKARTLGKVDIVSNAPYSISSDIIAWAIEQRSFIGTATLLLQKEFAERAAAEPGSKRYGALSVFCGQYTKPTLGFVVDGKQFHPPAGVDSRLIKLEMRLEPRAEVRSGDMFREIVRTAFSMRRKMLSNSIARIQGVDGSAEASELLTSIGIDAKRRPETLSIEEFAAIANLLSERT